MTTDTDGGEALKTWRTLAKLSQVLLAAQIGVGQSTLAEWERGTRRPELHLAVTIEAITEGAVAIERWGYSTELVAAMTKLVAHRANHIEARAA